MGISAGRRSMRGPWRGDRQRDSKPRHFRGRREVWAVICEGELPRSARRSNNGAAAAGPTRAAPSHDVSGLHRFVICMFCFVLPTQHTWEADGNGICLHNMNGMAGQRKLGVGYSRRVSSIQTRSSTDSRPSAVVEAEMFWLAEGAFGHTPVVFVWNLRASFGACSWLR